MILTVEFLEIGPQLTKLQLAIQQLTYGTLCKFSHSNYICDIWHCSKNL